MRFRIMQGPGELSLCVRNGETVIMKIVEPGELSGLSAATGGQGYEVTAETGI